ncbi:MAG: hypothetical protein K0U13_04310 [Chlamydiae bacterium]|nr:hypothetical protein [Chlamydiales bacterium]MCH9703994.1 hypothetical protein [Chlamydiota bacterium]
MSSEVASGNGLGSFPGYYKPSPCQYFITITGLAVGILITLAGAFAICGFAGKLPPGALFLEKFCEIGEINSYFVVAVGGCFTALCTVALIHLCQNSGRFSNEHS